MNAGTTGIATGSDGKLPYPGVRQQDGEFMTILVDTDDTIGQLLQAEETIRDPAQKNRDSR